MNRSTIAICILLFTYPAVAQDLRDRLERAPIIAEFDEMVIDRRGVLASRVLKLDSLIVFVICDSVPTLVARDWQGQLIYRRTFPWVECTDGGGSRKIGTIPPDIRISDDGLTYAVRDREDWYVCGAKRIDDCTIWEKGDLQISPAGSYLLALGEAIRVFGSTCRDARPAESCNPCRPRFVADNLVVCRTGFDSCLIDLATGQLVPVDEENDSLWRNDADELEFVGIDNITKDLRLVNRQGDTILEYYHVFAVQGADVCPTNRIAVIHSRDRMPAEHLVTVIRLDEPERTISTTFSGPDDPDSGKVYDEVSLSGNYVILRGVRAGHPSTIESWLHPQAKDLPHLPYLYSYVTRIDTVQWQIADTATVQGWYFDSPDCDGHFLHLDTLGVLSIVDLSAVR